MRPTPRQSSGASPSGANLVSPANAPTTPRTAAKRIASSEATTSIATSASLEFDISTNEVNGKAAHRYASTMPTVGPRTVQPSRNRPSIVSRSKVIAAACAAGRLSQVPLQPQICRNGT